MVETEIFTIPEEAKQPQSYDWRNIDRPEFKRILSISDETVARNRRALTPEQYRDLLAYRILAFEGVFDTFDTPDDKMKIYRDQLKKLNKIYEESDSRNPVESHAAEN